MFKVNYEGKELNVEIVQDAYISYQSWSPNPNNWVKIDGRIDGKDCTLLYKWDGEQGLEDIDYNNPYDVDFR